MGWVRRTDIGPTVWETPDGKLYYHFDQTEPALQVLRDASKRWDVPTNGNKP